MTEQEQATADATLKTKQQEEAFRGASAVGQKFGIDVVAEVNKISKEFINSKGALTEFSTQLKEAGISGEQSADLIYQAWQKWLGQAKNTSEIDNAKSRLMEMGVAGQVSGEQLNAGFKLADSAAKDLSRARDLADKARYSLALETTRSLKGGTTENLNTTKQEMEKTLNYWENQKGKSSVSSGNYQPIQVPTIQAPSIESPKMPNVDTTPDKNVRIEFASGGESAYVYTDEKNANFTEELFRELEQAKKRT